MSFSDVSTIPSVGFGLGTAWYKGPNHNTDGSPLIQSIIDQTVCALEVGHRHLDLAEMYGNDREVSVALAQFFAANPTVTRRDMWITSKLAVGMADPRASCRAILDRLNVDYLDLLLLHCPVEFARSKFPGIPDVSVIWPQMEALVAEGIVRNIGVSNYRIQDLEELLSFCNTRPAMNQIEFNPYLQQLDLNQFCFQHSIRLAAYSPLGPLNLWPGGPVDPVVEGLASKYGVSTSFILLLYTNQKGIVAITTSSKRERCEEYLSVMTAPFSLTTDEITAIDVAGAGQMKRKYWTENF
jgi:diketogulonate reductase-like aldo/keto reductase